MAGLPAPLSMALTLGLWSPVSLVQEKEGSSWEELKEGDDSLGTVLPVLCAWIPLWADVHHPPRAGPGEQLSNPTALARGVPWSLSL